MIGLPVSIDAALAEHEPPLLWADTARGVAIELHSLVVLDFLECPDIDIRYLADCFGNARSLRVVIGFSVEGRDTNIERACGG